MALGALLWLHNVMMAKGARLRITMTITDATGCRWMTIWMRISAVISMRTGI